MTVYNVTTPTGADSPTEADDRMQEIKLAIQERLAVEHKFALVGDEVAAAPGSGKHAAITCDSVASVGAVSGTDITGTGVITGASAVIVGAATVGGTLGVTGVATIGDTSKLATSAAPAADAQIANKKYVDDQIAAALTSFSAWAPFVITSGVVYDNGAFDSILLFQAFKNTGIGSVLTAYGGAAGITQLFTLDATNDYCSGTLPLQAGHKFKIVCAAATIITGWVLTIS